MKRLFTVLLAAIMLLSLCACKKPADNSPDTTPTTTGPMEAPASASDVATTFIRAYYLRDYATRFSLTFYDSRQQWEDNAIKAEGSAENFFDKVQQQADDKGIEATIDSFDSYYYYYHKFILTDVLDMYGKYTLTIQAIESKRMDDEELNTFRDKLLDAIDAKYIDAEAFHAVTEAYELKVNIRIDGEKQTYNENYLVQVVNHNGEWQVASHSI